MALRRGAGGTRVFFLPQEGQGFLAYVAEDGITTYTAEDGVTAYTKEKPGGSVTKLSSIAAAPSAPALSDAIVGVTGGVTDNLITVAQIATAISPSNVNTQTGASYTLTIGDLGGIVEMNNASANTLTVPTNASVAFPVGTQVDVTQIGAGNTTIAAAGGVTIISGGGGLRVPGQYFTVTLYQRITNTWVLNGAIV